MVTFFTSVYILSLAIAFSTLALSIYSVLCRKISLKIFPIAIRLYVIICYIPFVILISLSTTLYAIVYLISNTQYHPIVLSLNTVNSYLSQVIRTVFFTLAIERICATVFLEKYRLAHKPSFVWILVLLAFIFTSLYIVILFNFIHDANLTLLLYTYSILVVHLFSSLAFGILYFLNKRMYRITAYRISLQKRHKIAENLKILKCLFPSMIIYTMSAPIGSLITVAGMFVKLPSLPLCTFHIFHNLPNLIIFSRLLIINYNNTKVKLLNNVVSVKTVMGKSIPTIFDSDKYFSGLQQQWK